MHILQALHSDRVTVDLAVSDRASALTALANAFARCDVRLRSEDVNAQLSARERLASTNVGQGVAIPHARVPGLGQPQLAVSIADDGVDFEDDASPVHILVALLSDDEHPAAHLGLLSALVRALSQPRVRHALASARSVDDVLSALAAAELDAARTHQGGALSEPA